MFEPDDRRRGAVHRRRRGQIPVEVGERLVAERNRLAEELQRLRRENARTEEALRSAKVQLETARNRAVEAEEELRRVVSDQADDPNILEPLQTLERRVSQLTSDLNRLRQRTGKEIDGARRSERSRLLAGLGNVLDSVDRALRSSDENNPWRAGLVAVRSQLHAFIRGEGASVTGEVGERLDPRIHEAVGAVDVPDTSSGDVVRVERHGIVLEDGTVARTAQVVVAR